MKFMHSALLFLLSVAAVSSEAKSAPLWTFIPLTATTISVPSNGTATIKYMITNQSKHKKYKLLMAPITGITETSTCGRPMVLPANGSCTLTLQVMGDKLKGNVVDGPYLYQQGTDCSPTSRQCFRPDKGNRLNITLSTISEATLTVNPLTLALSVNNTATNAALTGHPRQITITNSSTTATAYNVRYTAQNLSPANPTIASSATPSSSCGDIAPLGTCVLKITPVGATPSATPYNTSPTPIVLTITGDNTNMLSPTVNILAYGSVYESGYVYSIDDTYSKYPEGVSVGGKVAALTDQAAAYPNGIDWGSNGLTGNGDGGFDLTDVSYDLLPGIDDASLSSSGSPLYSPTFTNFFTSNYTNINPFLSSSFSECNGATDGQCNTNNILAFYNQFLTNFNSTGGEPFSASAGPTPITYYAAGRCTQPINGYSDWYLPSICEMGPDSGNTICNTVTVEQNMVNNLANLLSSTCASPIGCLIGDYWSSTEVSGSPTRLAWRQNFAPDVGSSQDHGFKSVLYGVRCSRALTP